MDETTTYVQPHMHFSFQGSRENPGWSHVYSGVFCAAFAEEVGDQGEKQWLAEDEGKHAGFGQ
jgi:hypothetical protein